MEAEKPVQQAFGSPGGKSHLAPKIAGLIPEHKTYVEPFAGGAAVYFRKEPSEKEVLGDKDANIAFAFRFLRDMTSEQFKRLKQYNWKPSSATFAKLKKLTPKDDTERFYKFYYQRVFSFSGGDKCFGKDSHKVNLDKLLKVQARLKRTAVYAGDATTLIRKYDGDDTFFYLDPPYPDRAFVGRTFKKWTLDDLKKMVKQLNDIKGKVAISLDTPSAKLLPKRKWAITKLRVLRTMRVGGRKWDEPLRNQYEVVATNYKPKKRKRTEVTPTVGGIRV